jgi:hypothetical protein
MYDKGKGGREHESWEAFPQLGYEPVEYRDGSFHIGGPTWTEQIVRFEGRHEKPIRGG